MRGVRSILLAAGLLWPVVDAAAEPVLLEVVTSEARYDARIAASIINLKFSEKSARLIAQLTQENVGQVMHLRVDGKIVMSPVIREPILAGSVQISGGFTAKEAENIASSIRSGAKVEVEVVR